MEMIARALVDAPDQVTVTATPSETGKTIVLRVAPADLGKVIGRQGRTARSLRTIVAASADRQHSRCVLEIAE